MDAKGEKVGCRALKGKSSTRSEDNASKAIGMELEQEEPEPDK